jgi:Fur family zinc uptake transcriptional regulator
MLLHYVIWARSAFQEAVSIMFENRQDAPSPSWAEARIVAAERLASQAGATFTAIRRHVYEVLLHAKEPLGAYYIVDRLDGIGCARPTTAYRALDWLEDLGLIRKIRSLSKYVALKSGPSDAPLAFVICRECGTTEQIELGPESQKLLSVFEARGFQTLNPTLEISGRCLEHHRSADDL